LLGLLLAVVTTRELGLKAVLLLVYLSNIMLIVGASVGCSYYMRTRVKSCVAAADGCCYYMITRVKSYVAPSISL